ncbi:MAG: nucleotide exchange factor GrpE [Clostridiales bacterium]|nr:nucleotide exchange factor GrpE [Clostridiales bacterium]
MKHTKKEIPTNDIPVEAAEASTPEAPQAEIPAEEDLQASLAEAERQRDEYLTMAQRVQADFDNFRRRNASVRAEAYEDGAASFIKTLLPVCDNLERALAADSADQALKEGVQLVQKQLLDVLAKRGVTVIDRPGQPFDPKLEDAVVQGTPEEGEPGTVAQVLQKGYQMGDHVLRHAMVKVIVG